MQRDMSDIQIVAGGLVQTPVGCETQDNGDFATVLLGRIQIAAPMNAILFGADGKGLVKLQVR